MKGDDSKERSDFRKILEEEELLEEVNAGRSPGVTQVDDLFIKSLREKIERKGGDEEDSTLPRSSKVAGKEAEKPEGAILSLSEKTTEKIESEIKKGAAEEGEAPPAPFRSTPTSWHGSSVYVMCGPDAGRSFYLTGSSISIGRSLDNGVVLRDVSVSRKHCILTQEESEWFVEDLNSDNGTFINGKPIRRSAIKPGQYLQIGRTIIIIETS